MAAFIWAKERGLGTEEALIFASTAGGLACEKPYTSTVTVKEIQQRTKELCLEQLL
jgi:fructose-1-phosphate kinase PfkB-like protein